jgi:hypothetical protein
VPISSRLSRSAISRHHRSRLRRWSPSSSMYPRLVRGIGHFVWIKIHGAIAAMANKPVNSFVSCICTAMVNDASTMARRLEPRSRVSTRSANGAIPT